MKKNSFFIKNNLHLIPNILSIARIILTVIIVILLSLKNNESLYSFEVLSLQTKISPTFLAGGVIFIIASLTDFLDGFLARKFNWISDFGKIWDAVSDKILTTSVYVYFAVLTYVPVYFVLIMIFRDLVIDGYRIQTNKYGLIIPANIFGKLKAVLQMISIILIFFFFNSSSKEANNSELEYYFIQNLFVILATLASLISGVIYVINIEKKLKILKEEKIG